MPDKSSQPGGAVYFHTRVDPHGRAPHLSSIILGGQDGLVNVLGVILGVAAATEDSRIVLAAGLAATFAESVSMGAVAYTTTRADQARYQSEKERERRHIETVPELERDEVRELYRAKGFSGLLLEKIVETITADKEVWLAVMMAEEHKMSEVPASAALRLALVVAASAIVGSLIPLAPFLVLPVTLAMWAAVGTAALVLFGAGVYKALATVGHVWRSGAEMVVIGIASAMVGYLVGMLFKVPLAS